MYLEGKSYQQISNTLNKENVLYPKYWRDITIISKQTNLDTTVYMNVIEPIISHDMWEEEQMQKNQRNYVREYNNFPMKPLNWKSPNEKYLEYCEI